MWLRRAFWKNFGQNIDEAWRTWPEQEFHDAVSVLNAESRQQRAANSSSGSVAPETTQANFNALPRKSREEAYGEKPESP